MTDRDYLEAAMLFCFSISWYWSIAKMLRVGAAAGKSPVFVVLICTGYVMGIVSKLLEWRTAGTLSPIVGLYVWNLAVTALDLALVLYFTRRRDPASARPPWVRRQPASSVDFVRRGAQGVSWPHDLAAPAAPLRMARL